MSPLIQALQRVANLLRARDRSFALVGGLAVSVRCEPRFTRDADLCVAVANDDDAEALVRQVRGAGFEVLALVEQEARGRLATARLRSAEGGAEAVVIDLLFASSGIEGEVAARAEGLELVPGFELPVATSASLIALKVLSRDDRKRPQDRVDLLALLTTASEEDVAEARDLILQIEQRGYARGRDLLGDLDTLRSEHRDP